MILTNKNLTRGQTATVFGITQKIANPERIKLTLPPEDVAVVHIR